mmetsp:Transcript_48678/g.157269  ORF Transcript_48678/g.157269 Transcript_48678/m.157269 type:complete len:131 (-) Transcript_48678:782-1174(-)
MLSIALACVRKLHNATVVAMPPCFVYVQASSLQSLAFGSGSGIAAKATRRRRQHACHGLDCAHLPMLRQHHILPIIVSSCSETAELPHWRATMNMNYYPSSRTLVNRPAYQGLSGSLRAVAGCDLASLVH